MFTFIACLLVYIALLKWNRRYQIKYIQIHNMTNDEYNKIIEEKIKNYDPYKYA